MNLRAWSAVLYAGIVLAHAETLTLDHALRLAEEHNPGIRFATARTEGAQAGIVTARAWPNPEFNQFTGRQRTLLPGAAPGVLQHYSASWQAELPSLREARISAARIGLESSDRAMDEARLALRANVKQAFYQVLRRRDEIDLARQNLRLIEDLRRRIQVQVDVGEAARLELTRAEAEVATARTFARSAELRHLTALSLLRAAISAPLNGTIEPEGELETPQTLPRLEEVLSAALARHPSLAFAQAEVRRADARLRTEVALRKPQPTFRTEYEHQPDLAFFRIGISLPIPLLNRREGPIGEARAQVRQATAQVDLRRLELTSAVERAYGLYQVASQQVVAFQDGVLREAEEAVRAAEAAFRFGERGIIEVLDAQRVLRTVRLDFVNAQYDRQAALIELESLRAIEAGGNNP